jgi:outer membrane lipoprotein-sorting protein
MMIRFFILFVLIAGTLCSQILKDYKIISDMIDSEKKITSIRYKMKSMERIETGYNKASTQIKLQIYPRKSYLLNTENKIEILYNSTESTTKCLVKPHTFPYVSLNLDPRGNLIRKNLELGFDFTVKTIAIALSKEKEQIIKHLTLAGKVEKNNMHCIMLIYENLNFTYHDYVVQPKETVTSIANKLIVNDYMVRTKNKLYNDYGYLKVGSIIKIPSFYCKKGVFYIDEKTMLPISVSIFDEVGLFESYDYYEVELNKQIPDNEFKKDFKGYKF